MIMKVTLQNGYLEPHLTAGRAEGWRNCLAHPPLPGSDVLERGWMLVCLLQHNTSPQADGKNWK